VNALKQLIPPDPVFQKIDGWYFCDEVWADEYGPYETEDECRIQLANYCETL
jgi:hypothetical protein